MNLTRFKKKALKKANMTQDTEKKAEEGFLWGVTEPREKGIISS